eukprot:1146767-Pelagomonas_calceolata.AAC.4
MARLVEGMGSIDSPTLTQKYCVESGLGTLKLFAQFTVLLLAGSDQGSIRAAGAAFSLIRNVGSKEDVIVMQCCFRHLSLEPACLSAHDALLAATINWHTARSGI